MRYTHPIDRLVVMLRPAIAVLAVLALPVLLFSYGKMLAMAYYAWPGWAFALTIAAHLMGWLGISALFDSQQERRSMTQDEQS